jgi:hypothetical protein
VGLLSQPVVSQQALSRGQSRVVIPLVLVHPHQAHQRIGEQRLQPIALIDDPVVVEAVKKGAAIEGHRGFQAGNMVVGGLRLKGLHVEPDVGRGIELYGMEIAEHQVVGEGVTDVPQ